MMESRSPEIHIPMELWFIMLSFLPVKILLRFRAISKSFLSLIDDPRFVSFHLRSFPANRHESRLFVITREKLNIHETAIAGTLIDSFNTGFLGSYRFVQSSIDGISLLTEGHCRDVVGAGGLLLWNPSTRMSRRIPLPPWCVVSGGLSHSALIGYDRLNREYKVLFRQGHMFNNHAQDGVYSVSKDSWKTLDNGVVSGGLYTNLQSGVSFDGGVAWIVFDHGEHEKHIRLVLFDFGTETERYAAMPYTPTFELCYLTRHDLFRVDGGRGLGLYVDGQMWELEIETMTWTSHCKIGVEMKPLTRKENGEMVFYTSKKVCLYNNITMEIKRCKEVPAVARNVGVHVESLVKF